MFVSNLFPVKFWIFLAISFEWGSYDSKLLKITQNYYKSPLKVSELKVWVKYPPGRCIPKYWYSSATGKPSLNFVTVIKNSPFNQDFVYLV